jgi:hypothetical protein
MELTIPYCRLEATGNFIFLFLLHFNLRMKNSKMLSGYKNLVWLLLPFFGCKKVENEKSSTILPEVTITDNRNRVIHFKNDTVYVLKGPLLRKNGEQLIVDEGTLIKVEADNAADIGGITIEAGGIIQAIGSREHPIVFTSTTPTGSQRNNWNGITIIGKSFDNTRDTMGYVSDFSGSLRYVRIEFASLTLRAIGDGSIMDNIMVSYAGSQGQLQPKNSFNILGGTISLRNLISYACNGPADYYISNGYQGKMQNILAYRHPFFAGLGATPKNTLAGLIMETQSNPISAQLARPITFPKISNLSVIGPDLQNGSAPIYLDSTIANAALIATRNVLFRIRNSAIMGFPNAVWYVDDSASAENYRIKRSDFDYSYVHTNDTIQPFRLKPGTLPPYSSEDFRNYVVGTDYHNHIFYGTSAFELTDPYNYDVNPDPTPSQGSPLLSGADFTGFWFSDAFYQKVNYVGALGTDNWMTGWTNFLPLKTNYNFSR